MMLETGYNTLFDTRHCCYNANTGKEFTVLYLSDLHFNKFSEKNTHRIITEVNKLMPTIILLGGDYADSQKGLLHFETLLHSLSSCSHVYAIAGNHDYFIGIKKIKKIVTGCGIGWIEKSSVLIDVDGTTIQIDGNLLSRKLSEAVFSIACMHKPMDIKPYKDDYNLAFAGHLHGGQFVLWQNGPALYPGRFFYKWNVLEKKMGDCLYLISKGIGDTLPIRWNCRKEMIFVTVK